MDSEFRDLIHRKSLEILRKIGVSFSSSKLRNHLLDAGATGEDGRAKFENDLVEEALGKAPSRFDALSTAKFVMDLDLARNSNRLLGGLTDTESVSIEPIERVIDGESSFLEDSHPHEYFERLVNPSVFIGHIYKNWGDGGR